jgi:hypothetical protein
VPRHMSFSQAVWFNRIADLLYGSVQRAHSVRAAEPAVSLLNHHTSRFPRRWDRFRSAIRLPAFNSED